MPRQPRIISPTGYMHIIARGIGRQMLFEAPADYLYYLSLLKRYSKETDVTICAYCLMDNHVHLLVYDPQQSASLFMKKVGVSYAGYFNAKYDRTGHLFQDRYRSESINDDAYLLTVFRYILQNPQKANICHADQYPWSSYHLYDDTSFINTSVLKGMIGDYAAYERFIAVDEEVECMDYDAVKRKDDQAREKLCEILGIPNGMELQSYGKEKRDQAIRELKRNGLNAYQISRLTGLNRSTVHRIH
ncbi:MAG: transposase [Firmicutes bacterium]|nr:transposase [Bacillota bacterium]